MSSKIRTGLLLGIAVMLTACNTRVQEPWVQNDSYLKSERTRSPELAQELDRRLSEQNDR
jgi:hypothetical protein